MNSLPIPAKMIQKLVRLIKVLYPNRALKRSALLFIHTEETTPVFEASLVYFWGKGYLRWNCKMGICHVWQNALYAPVV